jgi:arginine decarboxylase
MMLQIAAATGAGRTELAAFDDALLKIGAGNYNLVRLSSVIPPASQVVDCSRRWLDLRGQWGDRLYAVYAVRCASHPGEPAWAALGWVQDDSGRGLFVEHDGDSDGRVRADLQASLDQVRLGRAMDLGLSHHRMVGATVTDRPVCALVLCAYATEPWSRSAAAGTHDLASGTVVDRSSDVAAVRCLDLTAPQTGDAP